MNKKVYIFSKRGERAITLADGMSQTSKLGFTVH